MQPTYVILFLVIVMLLMHILHVIMLKCLFVPFFFFYIFCKICSDLIGTTELFNKLFIQEIIFLCGEKCKFLPCSPLLCITNVRIAHK